MEHDGLKRKLSRRAMLRTSLQGAGAALLAACVAQAAATTGEATSPLEAAALPAPVEPVAPDEQIGPQTTTEMQ